MQIRTLDGTQGALAAQTCGASVMREEWLSSDDGQIDQLAKSENASSASTQSGTIHTRRMPAIYGSRSTLHCALTAPCSDKFSAVEGNPPCWHTDVLIIQT